MNVADLFSHTFGKESIAHNGLARVVHINYLQPLPVSFITTVPNNCKIQLIHTLMFNDGTKTPSYDMHGRIEEHNLQLKQKLRYKKNIKMFRG